jgi:hypothetical protein
MASSSEIVGRKIFFLYPSAVVQNQVIPELGQQEFEVYISKNHESLRRVLRKNPDSIVLVDINEKMSEKDWEAWITSIIKSPETSGVSVGIVSSSNDEELRKKYTGALKLPCGYIALRADLNKSMKQLIETLHAVEAKGQRKYIRVTTEKETNTTINIPWGGSFVTGQIKDISVVGISCSFESDPELTKNTLFKDIQIKLQSNLLKAEGIVFGSRIDEKDKIYVILFTQRIDPDVRTRIRRYIQQNLQGKMEAELR